MKWNISCLYGFQTIQTNQTRSEARETKRPTRQNSRQDQHIQPAAALINIDDQKPNILPFCHPDLRDRAAASAPSFHYADGTMLKNILAKKMSNKKKSWKRASSKNDSAGSALKNFARKLNKIFGSYQKSPQETFFLRFKILQIQHFEVREMAVENLF